MNAWWGGVCWLMIGAATVAPALAKSGAGASAGGEAAGGGSGEVPETTAAPVTAAPVYDRLLVPKLWLQEKTRLTLGVEYNVIGQKTSGGLDYDAAAEGTLDVSAVWTGWKNQAGTEYGRLGVIYEGRGNYGGSSFTQMTQSLGTLWPPNDATSDSYDRINQAWWSHSLADGAFAYDVGKLDPTVFLNNNRFASNGNTQFFSEAIVKNPAVAYPDNGLGATAKVTPNDLVYLRGYFGDGAANANASPVTTLDKSRWFYAGELGLTPKFDGLGQGTYRVMAWHRDTDTDDAPDNGCGFTLSCDQNLTDAYGAYLKYGYDANGLTALEHHASGGLAWLEPFDRKQDLTGAGLFWSAPNDGGLRDEYGTELFYRVGLTPGIELSGSIQLVFDPAAAPDRDVEAIFGGRLRFYY